MLHSLRGKRTPREGAGQRPTLLLDQGQPPGTQTQEPDRCFIRSLSWAGSERWTCARRLSATAWRLACTRPNIRPPRVHSQSRSARLPWVGSQGANISVGFDDDLFGSEAMQAEIVLMSKAHPNLPDEVPQGTRFAFAKESTGGLFARFRVGNSVYRNANQGSLHQLWESVHYIDRLLARRDNEKAAS